MKTWSGRRDFSLVAVAFAATLAAASSAAFADESREVAAAIAWAKTQLAEPADRSTQPAEWAAQQRVSRYLFGCERSGGKPAGCKSLVREFQAAAGNGQPPAPPSVQDSTPNTTAPQTSKAAPAPAAQEVATAGGMGALEGVCHKEECVRFAGDEAAELKAAETWIPKSAESHPQRDEIVAKLDALPNDVRRQYLIETERNRRTCEANVLIEQYHDCMCYGLEYLQARYEQPGDLSKIGFLRNADYKTCYSKPKISKQFYASCLTKPWSPAGGVPATAPSDPMARWKAIQAERQDQGAASAASGASAPVDPKQDAFCTCVGGKVADDFHTLRSTYLKDTNYLYDKVASQCPKG